jgi:hypothetical protein
MMLSQRGFTGKMKLKHKEEELHLLVSKGWVKPRRWESFPRQRALYGS